MQETKLRPIKFQAMPDSTRMCCSKPNPTVFHAGYLPRPTSSCSNDTT